jgi:hypothetical protein
MASEELNLSGLWKGIFNYPRLLPPNQFDAELRDYEGVLTGETFERGNGFRNKGQPLHAMIEGNRQGHEVNFVKRYDEFKWASTPVHYSGWVNGDGSKISGSWEIPGQWSGTFLMIRAKPLAAAVERKVSEVVR